MQTFSLWQILIFFPVGILAGIMSTVTGLASLVSYPALLMAGVSPVYANVTNTAALILNGIGSGVSSSRELHGHWKEMFKILLLVFVGGIIGSYLLLSVPSTVFERVVPFFIAIAGIMILWPEKSHAYPNSSTGFDPKHFHNFARNKFKLLLGGLSLVLIGIYGGYFGAAAGVIMLAVLSRTSSEPFPVYNAIRNVAMLAANFAATVIYAFKSHIVWILVLPLALGFLCGGYIGPKIVRLLPIKLLKIIIGILALILAGILFVQTYNL
ncbi:sulfite exporter TauE/SafE family protein [Apilactobacillus xinyiensis]|uniref:sulfite exporter TauE/SafE family protein n=1 Tax=Apilactobacillus xinyiensis TaxID=2841032 RepID=UPI0025530E61|nr:sulfite exporter TauE/SafE family protein [Apilactobacillus xinyiensis]